MSMEGVRDKIFLFPKTLVLLVILLSSIGLLMLYDATGGNIRPYAMKQGIYFAMFFPIMCILGFSNIKMFFHASYYIYAGSLILLIAVELIGHTAMGATRWINLGFFKLQPSELMKVGLVFALSKYFHTMKDRDTGKITYLLIPAIMISIPLLIIMRQPDLGTAIVLCSVAVIILYLAGVQLYVFGIGALSGVISMPILWHYLHDYQKRRILIFLDPEKDKLGAGYNIMQSKIAIGSGGFWGKGRLSGSQAQLEFLPEHQTDFVFSLFAEEFGFFGCVILLLLFGMLIFKGARIGINCKSVFGKLLSFGLLSIFSIHVFINIGMVIGVLPVVGLPLPFMSYGGTSMATMLLSFGFMINVAMNDKATLPYSELGYFN